MQKTTVHPHDAALAKQRFPLLYRACLDAAPILKQSFNSDIFASLIKQYPAEHMRRFENALSAMPVEKRKSLIEGFAAQVRR